MRWCLHKCRRQARRLGGRGLASTMSEGERGPRPPGSITIDHCWRSTKRSRRWCARGCRWSAGCWSAARDLRGRLGGITDALAGRLNRGESLVRGPGGGKASRSRRSTARSSRPGHGRAGCRSRSRAWRDTSAATPRPAPPSGWRSGIRCWFSAWRTGCSSGWCRWSCRGFIDAFEFARAGRRRHRCAGSASSGETADYWWPVGPICSGRARDRLGPVRRRRAVPGAVVELAAAFPVDEVDSGQLRDRQLRRTARAVARAPGALSGGAGPGRRVDRQPAV